MSGPERAWRIRPIRCLSNRRTLFQIMKSLLMAGIAAMLPLLFSGQVHAEPARARLSHTGFRLPKSASSRIKAEQSVRQTANWLFVVESKTQWLMVLANPSDDAATNDKSDSSGAPSGYNDSGSQFLKLDARRTGGGGQPQSVLPVKENVDSGNKDEIGMVFEGNTNDLPVVDRPGQPPKPSVSSS